MAALLHGLGGTRNWRLELKVNWKCQFGMDRRVQCPAWRQEEFRAAMLPRRRTGGLSSSRRRERRDRSAEVLISCWAVSYFSCLLQVHAATAFPDMYAPFASACCAGLLCKLLLPILVSLRAFASPVQARPG